MSNFNWVTDDTRKFMSKGYLTGQSVEKRCLEISTAFQDNLYLMGIPLSSASAYASSFLSHLSQSDYSLSTPVWVAYGNDRGLPVSCYNSHVDDSMDGILYAASEVGMLTKLGGGTSAYLGDLRPRGSSITDNGTADGPAHFARVFNTMMQVTRQGSRRGYLAAYLPIEHPDAEEFIQIGSDGSDIQNINTGMTFTDKFLCEAIEDDAKASLLAKFHKGRDDKGYPYALFVDNANNALPQWYKDQGYKIKSSNLCNEIMLPSTEDESYVCVLSSMNLVNYDNWKDTDAVFLLTLFLDTVVEESIRKLRKLKLKHKYHFLDRIERFLVRHRALGSGVLGWHHLLQSKMLPFASREAAKLNVEIFKYLRQETYAASRWMATTFGEPEVLKGYGMRNTTTMAIAPTKSSSFILGNVSEGIQPEMANCYISDLSKDTLVVRNPYLKKWLNSVNKDTDEIWDAIKANSGSLPTTPEFDFIPEEVRQVFLTMAEIDQMAIIDQAAARQPYIDQGQSLNLLFHPSTSAAQINYLFYYSWKMGIKGWYYQIPMSAAQAHNVKVINSRSCSACEG